MNICFNIGTLRYSGAEKIMYFLIDEFVKRGNSVSLILVSSEIPCDNLEGVKQYPIYQKYRNEKNRLKKTVACHNAIKNIVRNNKFDLIVSFGVIFNVAVAEACKKENVKLILCERNDPVFDPHSKLLRVRRTISYKRGDGFVFQTKVIKNFFPKRIQEKAKVIPNFIEATIEEEKRYNPSRNVFATSARLDDRQKDQSTMIKAFKKFHDNHEDYVLEFYGDGPDKEKLEGLAKQLNIGESVVFKGKVDNPMEYIRNTKAFVLTSVYEGMPNSLIEALAYGMPCIASDCGGGGARTLIDNYENGILFSVGDVNALATAMEKICDDDQFTNKISLNALKVNETLEKYKIMSEWNAYFQKVIRGDMED